MSINKYKLYYDLNNIHKPIYILRINDNLYYRFDLYYKWIIELNHFIQDHIFPKDPNYYIINLEDNYINMIYNYSGNELDQNLIFEILKIKINESNK